MTATDHRRLRLGVAVSAGALLVLSLATPTAGAAVPNPRPRTPGAADNFAPASRTVTAKSIYRSSGDVTDPSAVLHGGTTTLRGAGASVTLDFGEEVGGIVTVHAAAGTDPGQQLGLAFTESSQYVGTTSDASNGGGGPDGALTADLTPGADWTMPQDKLRGGFRYLTLFDQTDGAIALDAVSLHITFAPAMTDLRDYANYFHSSDPLLNKIWYAGAYTVETNTIAPDTGRVWGPPPSGWNNGATVGVGDSVLVDGAKRDRTVWPGDLGVSVPTEYASLGDVTPTRNALATLYDHQQPSGELPFAGPEVNFYGSDTYHLWTLIGTANYVQYTHDDTWLAGEWSNYVRALNYSLGKVGSDGLMTVTGTNDWARGDQGGENVEANALLYHALVTGAELAATQHDSADAAHWTSVAATLKDAINAKLWDDSAGQYRDNPTSDLHPQDGNSLAVWYGVAPADRAARVSAALTTNWNRYGATTPEKNGEIGTFPGSMEVQAHFQAGDTHAALALIRREWGYMLNSPLGTGSTFWEGYLANGQFGYGGAYMSAAHGWSTGPTSALTFYLLGIRPTTVDGGYEIAPQPGTVRSTEGSLRTPLGDIRLGWHHDLQTGIFAEQLDAPAAAIRDVRVPTFGAPGTVVTVNGRVVWAAGHSRGYGAHMDGDAVVLTGLPEHADIRSVPAGHTPTTLSAAATAATTPTVRPGDSVRIPVTVRATGDRVVTGTVSADVPAGWSQTPGQFSLDTRSGPVSTVVDVVATPPADAASGSYQVPITALGPDGLSAHTSVTVPVYRTATLYDFETGTQGWQPGANVSAVQAVTGFANGPGTPHAGRQALEAVGAAVDASQWRTISVTPDQPLDLSRAAVLSFWVDGYGGAPGASGYRARVVLHSDGHDLATTVPVSNDAWNQVRVDVSSWTYRDDITSIDVSFSPVGSTVIWPGRFQIDDVTWTDQPDATK